MLKSLIDLCVSFSKTDYSALFSKNAVICTVPSGSLFLLSHCCSYTCYEGSVNIDVVWLVRFYGISTFVGYLMPNPFLCK